MYEGDEPYELARQFSIKHNLNVQLTDLLANQIQCNIEQVLIERAQYEEAIRG